MSRDRMVIFGARRAGDPDDAQVFLSRAEAGNGELRRLLAAIAAGTVGLVLIDTRFNGHSGTRAVVGACRRRGVRWRRR